MAVQLSTLGIYIWGATLTAISKEGVRHSSKTWDLAPAFLKLHAFAEQDLMGEIYCSFIEFEKPRRPWKTFSSEQQVFHCIFVYGFSFIQDISIAVRIMESGQSKGPFSVDNVLVFLFRGGRREIYTLHISMGHEPQLSIEASNTI